jgi:glycosyltransferase involved in cell wall biosynthesis
LRKVGGFRIGFEGSQDYDLALRVIEQIPENHIRHIPRILYHWRAIPGSVALGAQEKSYAHERARQAIRSHFERVGVRAEVTSGYKHLHRIIYPLPEKKIPISLILLFDDGKEKQLRQTIENLLQETSHASIEFIVASPRPLKSVFDDLRVKVLIENNAKLAKLCNTAASAANGEILVFLQNGLRVNNPDWLREMASHAWRDEVGAVGAKILFPNGTIRSGGIILGINGLLGNAHRYLNREATGHLIRAQLIQNFSAVSGACLAVQKKKFFEVNGFDEKNFSSNLFSVDFCLRLLAKGYRIIWTPFAEIVQIHDSITENTLSETSSEIAYFKKKWKNIIINDPFYNINLTFISEDFTVAIPPRIERT